MQQGPTSLKHWRAFGPAEWAHVREGLLGLVLGSLLPVALFYSGLKLIHFNVGVTAVLIWSAAVFAWHLKRKGTADVFSATTFCFACIKASAGLISQNLDLYLLWPSLENMVYAAAFLVSALLRRPILALYAERLYPIPAHVQKSETFLNAFTIVSAAWFCGHALRAVTRVFLYQQLTLEQYLLADTVAGWPIHGTLIAFTIWYPLRQLRRAALLGASTPVHVTALDAVEEPAPTTV